MATHVLARSLRDQRRSLVVWVVSLAALVGTYAAVYSSLRGSSAYKNLFEQLPEAYRTLFGLSGGVDFTTPNGYVTTEILSFMGPLLVLSYAIGAGAGAIAGEEDRHTLDLLLANPISRHRLVLERFAALVVMTVLLCAVFWACVQVEGRAGGMAVSPTGSAAAFGHLALLGIEFGALALLMGGLSGHLTASRVVPALLAVAAYLLNGLAPLTSVLRPLQKVSPFYQYSAHSPLLHGVDTLAVVVSLSTTVVLVALSILAFRRRDVAA